MSESSADGVRSSLASVRRVRTLFVWTPKVSTTQTTNKDTKVKSFRNRSSGEPSLIQLTEFRVGSSPSLILSLLFLHSKNILKWIRENHQLIDGENIYRK